MTDQNKSRSSFDLSDQATLDLLSALEEDKQPSQRGLARRLGVALGMTNTLLKRAVHKGLVKVKNAPAKRYVYYITPKGFSEKSRLVADYLHSSLSFFRAAREQYGALYANVRANGHRRIALMGTGELAEIASLSAMEAGVELCGVIDPGSNQSQFVGLDVYTTLEAAIEDGVDAVVITCASNPQQRYEQLCEQLTPGQVYAVPLLHVTPSEPHAEKHGGQ